MTVESSIYNALKGLVGNRVFPDVAPLATVKPFITYIQIGGEAVSFLERAVPSKQNGSFQIDCYADTRAATAALALQVESAMVTATTFQSKPVAAPSARYDSDMLIYSSTQDFSVWSDR